MSKSSSHDNQYKQNFLIQMWFRLNPELNLDIYNLAIYDKNGTVFYEVIYPSSYQHRKKLYTLPHPEISNPIPSHL